mgnify:CR=1 FL=1
MRFHWNSMRTYLLLPSLLLLAVSLALPLLVAMGGANPRNIESNREQDLKAANAVRRGVNRTFYWLVDHRPLCGVLGTIGLVISIFWK